MVYLIVHASLVQTSLFVDMKVFMPLANASARLDPLKTSLCHEPVENSAGLILAATPLFKKISKQPECQPSYNLPFCPHP